MQSIFRLRSSHYSLRNTSKLPHIRPKQTTLGPMVDLFSQLADVPGLDITSMDSKDLCELPLYGTADFFFYIHNLKIYILTKHIYINDIIGSMIGMATLNDL